MLHYTHFAACVEKHCILLNLRGLYHNPHHPAFPNTSNPFSYLQQFVANLHVFTSVSTADIPEKFDVSDIPLLSIKLGDITHKYRVFGILLGIADYKIKEIEARSTGVRVFLAEMLTEWRKAEMPLSDVLEAIRSVPISNRRLAHHLEEKWRRGGYSELVIVLLQKFGKFERKYTQGK